MKFFKKKVEETKSKEHMASDVKKRTTPVSIKILGSGCKNCETLTQNVKVALEQMHMEASIEKVTDYGQISAYGVMSTPALVVDEKVLSYGKVLKSTEIINLFDKI